MGKVVVATATMVSHGRMGPFGRLTKQLQDVMRGAVIKAQVRGVTDGDELRRVQFEARDRFLSE